MRTQRIAVLAVVAGAALTATLVVASRAGCSKAGSHDGGRAGLAPSGSKISSQAEAAPIQVLVTKLTPQTGRVEYHYTVTNGSTFPVHILLVGNDEYYGRSLQPLSHWVGWRHHSVEQLQGTARMGLCG